MEEPFVGRAGELAVLGRLFERTGHGHGQVALVVGAAGIGKTALTRRCLSSLAGTGTIGVRGS